jgi:hypothetical protein
MMVNVGILEHSRVLGPIEPKFAFGESRFVRGHSEFWAMKLNTSPMWLLLRAVIVCGVSWEIILVSEGNTNIDWLGCFLIAIASGISIYIWIAGLKRRQTIDWTEALSLAKPFYPMNTYPIRFWVLTAETLLVDRL